MGQDLTNPLQLRPFVFIFMNCLKSNHYNYLKDRIHEWFLVFLKHSQIHDVFFTKSLQKSFLQKCLQKCLSQNHFKNACSDCVNICVHSKLSLLLENLWSTIWNGIRMIVGDWVVLANYKSLTKIWKHEHKLFVDQHISRLDIQMNNVILVEENQALNGLVE
jgi:hypothetical protein